MADIKISELSVEATPTISTLVPIVIGGVTKITTIASMLIPAMLTIEFTDASLVAGVLTLSHSMNTKYVNVSVWNNLDALVTPDDVTPADTATVVITKVERYLTCSSCCKFNIK